MIEIYLLEQLDAFARNGTLSAAADELHITQPALSRSMKRIEKELGVTLFDRGKSKIALNETGRLAAELARTVLRDDEAFERRVIAYDRNLRTITFGSCAPWPILATSQVMHVSFPNMAITSEVVASDEELLRGLRNRTYQLVALHELPEARDFNCQYLCDENMTLSVKKDHPLTSHASVTFDDLAGESILAWGNVSFWNDVLREHLPNTNLLFQTDFDTLDELITKTDFPNFSSDCMAGGGYVQESRVDIPIDESDAHASYYIACLDAEKDRYASFFNALRSQALAREK